MNLKEGLKSVFPFVEDFKKYIKKEIETVLKVDSKRLQTAKDGKKFLLMTLSDRTGSVRAVDWHNAERTDEMVTEGDVVRVKGKVVIFEGRLQLNVGKEEGSIEVLSEEEINPERFVRRSERDPDEMFREAMKLVDSMKDVELKEFVKVVLRSLRDDLVNAPAAVKHHHAYMGGLLEHSLTVAKMVDYVSKIYGINRDMAIAGALLHDIGKIREYAVGTTGIEVTTEGELKGHIVIGVEMIRAFARKVKLSPKKLLELEHIIISHHGEQELGSPVVPKTPEALVVHFIENMDSKMARMIEIAKNSDDGREWSDYDRGLGRRIFLNRR